MIIVAHILFFGSVHVLRAIEPACAVHLKKHEVSVGIDNRGAEVMVGVEILVVFGVGLWLDRDVL